MDRKPLRDDGSLQELVTLLETLALSRYNDHIDSLMETHHYSLSMLPAKESPDSWLPPR